MSRLLSISPLHKAVIAIIITNIIWGAAPPIFKFSLDSIAPFTLGFIRFFFGGLVLLPFVYRDLHIAKEDIKYLFYLAFFGILLNISCFLVGVTLSSSLNVPIIGSSGPIFLILFSYIFLHEKPKKKVIVGTLLSLMGVLIIILRPIFETQSETSLIGNILFVISTLASITHLLFLKKIAYKYRALTITFWTFFIGSMMFLPLVFFELATKSSVVTLNIQSVTGILYGIFLSSALAWFFEAFAVKRMPANEVGIFIYIDPIVTALVALPLLGEMITFSYLLGSLFVFLGIFIAEGRLHWHPFHLLHD